MTSASELEVWLGPRQVGHLLDDGQAGWSFVYADGPDWTLPPVGIALPRTSKVHQGERVSAVFAALLPDGSLRSRLARSLGLSQGNDFGLLSRVARETPGALSLRVPGLPARHPLPPRRLDRDELRHAVAALVVHPLLAEVDGLAKTLPGEYDKLPVRVHDGLVSCVLDDALTTHVLKPARPGLRESVANEAFCMALAAAWGLPVARTEMLHGAIDVLAVTRVDRQADESGAVRAIHMEDFCQALGHPPGRPYEREGGPRLSEIAALLRRASRQPAVDLRALVGWLVFAFLVGYGAGHARQLALLLEPPGPRLAPFYGLWSTHVYPEMNLRMALRIGLEDRPDWLSAERWRDVAGELGVRPAWVLAELERAARQLPRIARETADEFHRRHGFFEVVRGVRAVIEQRARQALVSLASAAAASTGDARRLAPETR